MTTPPDFSGMTDAELIELCAVRVMGWTWSIAEDQGHAMFAGWKQQDEKLAWRNKDWNPLTDWNHTMEVVEKLRKSGIAFSLDGGSLKGRWCALFGEKDKLVVHENPQRAICLAALLAVSS